MKIMITGGDGYCGWPLSLHLSKQGHDVVIVDNYIRRNISNELLAGSITPIAMLHERVAAWKRLTDKDIEFYMITVSYPEMCGLLSRVKPDAVIHLAEQRSSVYSMRSGWHRHYTIQSNMEASSALLSAMVETHVKPHFLHLGSLNVYGYELPEGYILPFDGRLRIRIPTPFEASLKTELIIRHPSNPGSVYDATQCMNQIMFDFYNRNEGIPITDAMAGIVWGADTEDCVLDPQLCNRLDYDGDYGTVVNRFMAQAITGHPLTVYGDSAQWRAFIHIKDLMRCLEAMVINPPKPDDPIRYRNVCTEIANVDDIANVISKMSSSAIRYMDNIRKETPSMEFRRAKDEFTQTYADACLLEDAHLEELAMVISKHSSNVKANRIISNVKW